MKYTKDEIRRARVTSLADYLDAVHPGELESVSRGTFRKADQHSLKINRGIGGYCDFGNGSSGNSIDYLTKFLGYSFTEAVGSLLSFENPVNSARSDSVSGNARNNRTESASFMLPEKSSQEYRQLYAYLIKTRGIPADIVKMLIRRGLLYQSEEHNNAVFVSADNDFYEIRGTNSAVPFHFSKGIIGDECWYFIEDETIWPSRIYITEGSIDAISLYALQRESDSVYAAIGGAGKQRSIDRLKNLGVPIIIATDNDEAGDNCRAKNAECRTIRPQQHDWNDDLVSFSHP